MSVSILAMNPIIIIGTGLAGYTLAREIRKLNPDIPLTLITSDEGAYYSKPQLSTALTYKKSWEQLQLFSAEKMTAQLKATILTKHFVTAIDTEKQVIHVNNQQLPYSKLVIACGAETIKPRFNGNAADQVLHVNNLSDYQVFQEKLINKKRIAIIGCGLVGCEFTNDLLNAGYQVEIIALSQTPLDTHIPPKVGTILQNALTQLGAKWHLQESVEAVDLIDNEYEVSCKSGLKIKADMVLSAVGIKPLSFLAKQAGLMTAKGILTDVYLQTSNLNIYALGDCAEVEGHLLPYVAPIVNCAKALAQTLLGNPTKVHYPAMPVIVKTPVCPIAICPPSVTDFIWNYEIEGNNVCALAYDKSEKLVGFVLTGEKIHERPALVAQLSDIIPIK